MRPRVNDLATAGCHADGTLEAHTGAVVYPLPQGVSGLVDPDDAPYIDFLESCAASRRRLGLPSYSRAELEQLFLVKDAPAPPPLNAAQPPNLLRLPARRPSRRDADQTG